ncbi:hypothetical protein GOC59_31100 [Sinorhizobium medicae]|nr:hypothetical protein [Sinorhizobium medicae]MDX0855976.1 hypothetical protein [Sinorhizobium medicae]MDX0907412.1 hypothetical protein [Sinorhizobium medicae]MDX1165015.1 hypothetical protein [Sinorhizobium medicae]MDX1210869.1 hypothetical protein [Sinorhizobium medicae]
MKSAVVAASTPSCALAPILPASIGSLLVSYADVRSQIDVTDEEVELDRLLVVENDLNEQILSYRCATLDDVRMKATHIDRVYADRMSAETAQKILQSLIT